MLSLLSGVAPRVIAPPPHTKLGIAVGAFGTVFTVTFVAVLDAE